jgi:hypothetical protein
LATTSIADALGALLVIGQLSVGSTRPSRMIQQISMGLCLLLAGCAKASSPRSLAPTPPLTQVVIGGVYAIPSFVPDHPYWCIWKVLAEENGKIWYMSFTNEFPADSRYSRPPRMFALNALRQQGTDWGASMKPTKEFLRASPIIHYLGQQGVTTQESDGLRISMKSYYETFEAVRNAGRHDR